MENNNHTAQKIVAVIAIIAIFGLSYSIAIFVRYNNVKANLDLSKMKAQVSSELQIFENTKYKYSFQYPGSLEILQDAAYNSPEYSSTTQEASSIIVNDPMIPENGFTFYITRLPKNKAGLTETYMKSVFGDIKPGELEITPATLAGKNGYKAIYKTAEQPEVSEFYFIQNSDQEILQIHARKDSQISQKILESLIVK